MEKFDIYNDITTRTGGDIYIGVVGPVRTGKSTFITKFMENLVVPNISNKLHKQIAIDEMPQSADGKTIMTTQPKFVPANGVKVQFKNKSTANVRLVDCVGYLVDGVIGHEEEDRPRLVKTPWDETEMPFEKAAEIGTKKVIDEYSTIGILITSDGSFGELPRQSFINAEKRVVNELKDLRKPFIILLNTKNPEESETIKLASNLEEEYGVTVLAVNLATMNSEDIGMIMEKVLLEFPMSSFNVNLPKWMQSLPAEHNLISDIIEKIKGASNGMSKMRDFAELYNSFVEDEKFKPIELLELKLGEGVTDYCLDCKDGLFYNILSEECGENITDDYELMSYIKGFADSKRKFSKIKQALHDAEENGYGVVMPTLDEMNLEEPTVVKQGGRYGVKLKATAPSLHIMKVDVSTEVAPIVGSEKQSEDLINYIMNKFEDNPSGIWETNMFGKSLYDLVNEGLIGKIMAMPKDTQSKMRKTVTRIVNESRGGVICILL